MRTIVATALAALAAGLTAAAVAAGTVTVQIKGGGFSPSSLTIEHGTAVTWHDADTVDHQIVADDGSFASPILHAGRSWTFTFARAGSFRYHDALHPKLSGKVTVQGPPPSLTLALSTPIVTYGQQLTVSGAISTGQAGQSVELDQQAWGQPSATQLAIVKTGSGGAFSYVVAPSLYTTYVARWANVASGSVVAQVAPSVGLLVGGDGWMKVVVASPTSLWHRHVYLQRLSAFGQWVNVAALALGQANGRLFRPAGDLPKGVSHVRVFLSINEAGDGLLAAHSGTETVVKTR